eukprot:1718562-Karenia_brevis.AAC.1
MRKSLQDQRGASEMITQSQKIMTTFDNDYMVCEFKDVKSKYGQEELIKIWSSSINMMISSRS